MIKNLLAEASETSGKGNGVMTYVLLGGIILVIILMFVFNTIQRKRAQKEATDKLSTLKVGDKIKTIGMIVGEIVELCEDGTIVLLTGSEKYPSYIRIEKMAIYLINPDKAETPENAEPFGEMSEVSVDAAAPAEEAETEVKIDNVEEVLPETPVETEALTEKAADTNEVLTEKAVEEDKK